MLKNDFIDPFSADLDHDKLYNLASGNSVADNVAKSLLTVRGTLLRDDSFNQSSDWLKRVHKDKRINRTALLREDFRLFQLRLTQAKFARIYYYIL